ncbi:hypothetical protein OIE68_44725 [Nocardia vinacea]|uniref:hypothetical protein n=1 Tax=Nocardia vinacea TaxID=96468 RepID=UPI002E0D836D|nr:hypothetical protein OIE68_44725 [Nocardia vinacea]
MAVVPLQTRAAAVDIAGSAWPMYKLEAIALGLLICLALALITGSLQVAVLVAAGVGTGRWVVGQIGARGGV